MIVSIILQIGNKQEASIYQERLASNLQHPLLFLSNQFVKFIGEDLIMMRKWIQNGKPFMTLKYALIIQ